MTILVVITFYLILTGAGCPGEVVAPEFEWVLPASMVPPSDTVLVGDTLTLSATIPDSVSDYGEFIINIDIGMKSDTSFYGIDYFNIKTVIGQYKDSRFHVYHAYFSGSGKNEKLKIILVPKEAGEFFLSITGGASRRNNPEWSNVWFYFDDLKSPDEEYVYGVHNVKYYTVKRP